MEKNIGIQEFLVKHMVFIAFVTFGLLLLVWSAKEYAAFSFKSELLKEEYFNSQKSMLKIEVNNVVEYIEYMKSQTEKQLKLELQLRVKEAIDIASNINQENQDKKTVDTIKKMVKDALRPIRFLNGRGYYFAFSMDGIETLFADRPEMESLNMLSVQGTKGEYVVRDMIDIVKKNQEGFYKYTWTKPSRTEKGFPKIAFIKYFKPFDWAIGTGEYLDDFTDQIQNQVLERIVGIRFSEEGYFFGSMDKGYPLFTGGKITKGSNQIWEMTDPDGIKIIQEQQKVSKNPDGGFVRYSWHRLGDSVPVPKISFVREIPEWNWTVGAGVYLDSIEKIVERHEDTLRRELVKNLLISIGVFLGIIFVIWFWAKRVAQTTQESIKTFETSFEQATTAFIKIPADDMQFSELSRIAESANRMIASQKQTQKALLESEERYRAIVEDMPGMICSFKTGGKITFVNKTYCDYFEIEYEKLIGHNFLKFVPDSEQETVMDTITSLTVESPTQTHEHSVILPDGERRWQSWTNRAIFDNKGTITQYHSIGQDITGRKRMEKALRHAQRIESIGKLAGGIAHDFNNILYPIIGFTQISMDELPNDHPVQENLKDVLDGAKRARDLVKQILLFSRQKDRILKPILIKPVIQETLKLLRSLIPINIKIQSQLYKEEDYILCDETEVHEIVMNLCTNAYHSLEDKGDTIKIRLDKKLPPLDLGLPEKKYLCLSVSDNGKGIGPEIKQHIFDPYFTTKEVGRGSGLGLSVVHGIVKSYQGGIHLESSPEKGSVFDIFLPITSDLSAPKPEKKQIKALGGSENILFVDDEQSIVKLGVRALENAGYDITGVSDSSKAFELFKSDSHRYDLVITDMAMPGMVGSVLAQKILEIRPDIPIIICSGFSERLDAQKAKNIDIKAFIDKPILMNDLIKTVRHILDQG